MAIAKQSFVVHVNGPEGNIFDILHRATKILINEGFYLKAKEMQKRVFITLSYEEALKIISEYVKFEMVANEA